MGTDWVRISLLVDREMAEAINEWRRRQPDLPDRNEALRRLLAIALRNLDLNAQKGQEHAE